jgi:Domain of unknown function (DUF4407)
MMVTDTPLLTQLDSAGIASNPYRPAEPARGLGPRMRALAGVTEEVLDWAPEERPRYSRLGVIVLNTGALAALSLSTALGKVADISWAVLLPVAMLWGFVIISFDGWLVASTHGVLNAARLRIFIPRLLISLLMGAVIAEPLLLWFFQPAIHKEVAAHRQQELAAYESRWKTCNPNSGSVVGSAECKEFQLNVVESPQVLRRQLADLTDERNLLRAAVDEINEELAEKNEIARNQCNRGVGCLRARREANQYRTDNRVRRRQRDLDKLNHQIDDLNGRLAEATRTYESKIGVAIAEKVATKRQDQNRSAIGILEEGEALERLAGQSQFVLVGQWLLRLLLIAIDCMPVLAKLMSRTTTYDVLLSRQLEAGRRLHDRHIGLREREDIAAIEAEMQRTEHQLRHRIGRIEDADRASRAKREADLDAEIEELADQLRRQGGAELPRSP